MFSLTSLYLLLTVGLSVNAQIPTPPSTFPPFSSTQTASSTLSSTTSLSQSSTSTTATSSIPFPSLGSYSPCGVDNFTAELVACILANCAEEVKTAQDLAQQFCNVASGTPSLSFPPVPTTTTSDTTSSTATTPPTSVSSPPSTPSTGGSAQRHLFFIPAMAEASVFVAFCTISTFVLGFYVTM
ncbi:hypothetical protein CVT24_011931 [Panaeolus cyanescens]|uniref:Extracellular membrane protein CFEM domain-containing protein n=1 Tax=Panaeolus cyanescens TaxID=181874 RepID=A0A409VXM2_9AGAR|nr:hypothetical protein CVT24_011931 [Panaeolus cyanescens]